MLHAPIMMGFSLHVIVVLSSLWTVTLSFVKTEIVPVSDVLPLLMSECEKSSNMSASVFYYVSWGTGSVVTLVSILTSPFAIPTLLVDQHSIGSPDFFLAFLLM